MKNLSDNFILTIGFFLITGLLFSGWFAPAIKAQTNPLTYPEIITALNTKLPNTAFKDKTALMDYLVNQVKQRKMDKSLSSEMEGLLRQSGATDELIRTIRFNTPTGRKIFETRTFSKAYPEMSNEEKNQFVEYKVEEFLNKFGQAENLKVSAEGLALIRQSMDNYLKRLSVDEKSTGDGNDGEMVSKNSCNYGRSNLATVFRRGGQYIPVIGESFGQKGIQPEIGIYLAFIEAEFCPCIQSGTGALGMFQLTHASAQTFGIKSIKGSSPDNPDERCNPKAASKGAASYIGQLIDKHYGSDANGVLFAVSAYNSGEGGLNKNIRTVRELGKTNVTFWDLIANKNKLIQQFQEENYRYLPKFLAALIIGENPKSFGIVEFEPLSSLAPKNISKVNESPALVNDSSTLKVALEFWSSQREKALEPRKAPTGTDLKGVVVPKELSADITKQMATLREMKSQGFAVPMDFFDLVQRNLNKELIELPMATDTYLLDVGGNATEDEFTKFSFQEKQTVPSADSPEYRNLKAFTDKISGQKYDLDNPRDRRQIRIRLLRILHPKAKAVLEELAQKYNRKFNRPLRVTSLTRSLDYQVGLNATSASSFLVKEDGPIPPHCSGQAFDLGYKHMTAEEQNFMVNLLAQMERSGRIDAVRETGVNAALHVFVF
jgi:hypothetical protein